MRKILTLLFVVLASWIAYQLYQLSVNHAEPIITTSADKMTAKSLPIKADAPLVPSPAPVIAPVAEPTPVLPPPTPEVNPLAPCPAKIYACFGALANNIIDPTCPVYKPVWAYLSKDEGANWLKVGCYATEIDAEKAIDKAHKGMLLASKQKIDNKEPAKTDIPVVATNPEVKRAHKTAEEHKTKPEGHKSKPENKTASEVPPVNEVEPSMHEHALPEPETSASGAPKGYVAQFKGGLGFVNIASRTYPTEEMKKKALDMWDKDMRLLEPDGTINDKYMLKKPSATPLPGHY